METNPTFTPNPTNDAIYKKSPLLHAIARVFIPKSIYAIGGPNFQGC